MTPADKRVLDLLDRWLASIELHLKYLDLNDADYRQIQSWPEHERPARWILELAQQKVLQLKTLSKAHVASKDESFAESLELMGFLANLVGAQNIKRSIPLADPASQQAIKPVVAKADTAPKAPPTPIANEHADAPREMPQLQPAPLRASADPDGTREMPRLKVPAKKTAPTPTRSATETTHKRASAKSATAAITTTAPDQSSIRVQELVVADAVRLLKWGRDWHELTELIARMAERPAAVEIRRILRMHKNRIEAQLRG